MVKQTSSEGERAARGAQPRVRMRVRITVGDAIAVGPGRIDLLEAVARHGSIAAAARSLGMSYRRAWLLLDALNQALHSPAITTAQGGERGGGSRLTPAGEALLRHYRQLEADTLAAGAAQIDALIGLLKKP